MKRRRRRVQTRETPAKEISIAREADYIVARAMAGDARVVSLRPLVFFSTVTGDAWLLDAEDSLALPLAAAGSASGGRARSLRRPNASPSSGRARFKLRET